jgi:enamine deaminase RidA (YjgF/YER057c/UK114 family)
MIMNIEEKLLQMGYQLEEPPTPLASYLSALVVPPFLFTSGAACMVEGKPKYLGKVGRKVSIEQGYEAAQITALNLLSKIKGAIGDLERIDRIVRLTGYVNCDPDFTRQSQVMDGASDLLVELFGESGRHVRTALGVSSLPLNLPLEIEMMAQIKT